MSSTTSSSTVSLASKACVFCGATLTPVWRYGPSRKRDLCNNCGINWLLAQRAKEKALLQAREKFLQQQRQQQEEEEEEEEEDEEKEEEEEHNESKLQKKEKLKVDEEGEKRDKKVNTNLLVEGGEKEKDRTVAAGSGSSSSSSSHGFSFDHVRGDEWLSLFDRRSVNRKRRRGNDQFSFCVTHHFFSAYFL